MKKKDMIEGTAIVLAFLALVIDITAIALEIHTLNTAWFRFIYIPVFVYNVIQTARDDMKVQREHIRQINEWRKARNEQQFLEDYAKFVSEVHK